MIKCERKEAKKYEKALQGEQLTLEGRSKSVLKDGRIKLLMERIEKNKISMQDFLEGAGQRVFTVIEHNLLEIDEQNQSNMSNTVKPNESLPENNQPSTSGMNPHWSASPSVNVTVELDQPLPQYSTQYAPSVKPVPNNRPATTKNDRLLSYAMCCKLCHNNPLQLYFRPCGHVWCCIACWDMISISTNKPSCPKCFKPVAGALRAYFE